MPGPDSNLPQSPGPHDGWEMVCDGILRTEFGRRPSRAVFNAIMQLAVEEALQSRPARPPAPVSFTGRIHNWRHALTAHPKFTLGAALLCIVGLAAFLWSAGMFAGKPAANLNPVCILSDAVDVSWANGAVHPKIGDALPGETLRLVSGVVELTFASTAKVAVEGPAEFKLTGFNSLELMVGKISTDVPLRARGFTVKTPAATAVDLGTRFGALVNSDHATEVDVFQGRVELMAGATAGNPGGRWPLTEGMAMIADNQGAEAASALPEGAFPQPAQEILARPQNCGFDVLARAALGGIPLDFGYWSGPAYLLAGPNAEVRPFEGSGMLRFLAQPSDPAADSEVWQLIDLHPFRKLLSGGLVTAELSAEFNRIKSDARAGDKFGLTLAAFHGVPSDAKSLWTHRSTAALALADKELTTDNDPATWEKIEVSARLPAQADFVIVEIRAIAPIEKSGNIPLFPGHFADRVDLKLGTPLQPSSIAAGR